MPTMKCPTCGKSFDRDQSTAAPFCSPRCRQIDLGRWIDGRYAIPGKPIEEADEADDASPDDEPVDE